MNETYLKIIKSISNEPIANLMEPIVNLNGDKMGIFPLKSGMQLECPFSPLLFEIMLEVLAMEIKQE